MKFISILIFLIFNSILWSLINSVKNNKNQKELTRVEETSNDLNKILNDGAESSVAPQNQKYKEILKPKITKMYKNDSKLAEKMIKKKEYNNDYYQKNKEKKKESARKYQQNNKEKIKERKNSENFKQIRKKHDRNYRNKNREKILENKRIYNQNNKEKRRESARKYREKKKNEKETLKNDFSKLINIQSNEGNLLPNTQNNECESKEKEPIVSKENIQLEKGEDVEGNNNAEGTLFVNPQTDSYVNNLSDANACPYGQPNVQSFVGLHTQQMDDHDELVDLSLLDDSYFLDYLNSLHNS